MFSSLFHLFSSYSTHGTISLFVWHDPGPFPFQWRSTTHSLTKSSSRGHSTWHSLSLLKLYFSLPVRSLSLRLRVLISTLLFPWKSFVSSRRYQWTSSLSSSFTLSMPFCLFGQPLSKSRDTIREIRNTTSGIPRSLLKPELLLTLSFTR